MSYRILERLATRELLTPYLESAMLSDKWPDKYYVEVDSSPYTGTGDGWFHPSSHTVLGARELYFTLHPDYRHRLDWERRTLVSAMTLSMGSALHAVVQTQFQMAGLCSPEDIEVPAVSEKHRGRGSMDFRVHHPTGKVIPVELKTQNTFAFEREKTPKDIWVGQLNCYMDWLGYEEGIVLVMESGYPYRFKEFRIQRDEKLLKSIYDKWDYVRDCIDKNQVPEVKCCPLNSTTMKQCPARNFCLETY